MWNSCVLFVRKGKRLTESPKMTPFPELAIFGKTPMKLPLAKRSFDLALDIWLGNRKEPNSQMHVQWFH